MTDERHPMIQALFANAEEDLAGDDFVARVMERTQKQVNKTLLAWVCVGLLVLPIVWMLTAFAQDSVYLLTRSLTTSLFDLDHKLLAQVVSPVNNFGFMLALIVVGLRMVYRKIFSGPGL